VQAIRLEQGPHYRVVNRRIEITPDLSLPDGILQVLQVREGLPVTGRLVARGKLTFQRFFRRYESLAALCRNVNQIRDELWQVYGLPNYVMTPAALEPYSVDLLSDMDRQIVESVSGLNTSLGQVCSRFLISRHMRKNYKAAKSKRRDLLKLDDQVGTMTAFSGRAE
jgi:hypothetical protein